MASGGGKIRRRPGELRHRIEIQQNSPTRNAFGEEVQAWTTIASRWASIRSTSKRGSEKLLSGQYKAEQMHTVVMWYYPGLTVRHRIRFGVRILDITSISNTDERNIELVLECVERV